MNLENLAIILPILIIAVVIHEVSHGKMAQILGDPTAKNMGRLSLNPVKHLDPFGSFLLPLMMILVSGMGLGYAKPVPIDPRYFKDPQKGMALTALAGPLSNFTMAILAGLLFKIGIVTHNGLAGKIVLSVVLLNVFLGTFNLLPMPPLDGSKILAGFLPKSALYSYYRLERYGMLILLILLVAFPQVLNFVFVNIIMPLANFLV